MESTQERLREALRPIEDEYREDYKAIAAEALDEHPGDEEDQRAFIRESVEGSEWVIYTYLARAVLLLSENADAHEDCWTASNPTAPEIAYCAMVADCESYLRILKGGN